MSGGNPLYALAIARELEATKVSVAREHELPLPRTLTDAIAQRLARLDPRAADPLLVLAALSNPSLALIQAVLPDFALSDLESAERTEVIEVAGEGVRFTRPLLASTHYSQAQRPRRRELHRLLAEVVPDAAERAHHVALGAEAPDPQIAVTLEQAAGDAARRGAPEVAAELLEHACRLTPADAVEALRSRTVTAAEQHFASGDLARARAVLETLLPELPDGPTRARALLRLAKLRSDDFEASTALAEQALAQVGSHDRVSAQIELLLSELWTNRGDRVRSHQHAEAAVELAERANDPGLLSQSLAAQGTRAFFHGKGVQHTVMARAIELEDHAEETPSYYMPSTSLGNQLFWSDQLDAARPLLERALRRASDRGEEYDRAGVLFHLAHLEWEAGNNEVAARYTEDLIEAARQQSDDQGDSYVLWLQAFRDARHGALDEARERANDAIEVAGRIGDTFIVAFSTAILAAVELWTGQPQAAHKRLPPVREAMVANAGGLVGSLTLVLWSYDIEALIATGRLAEAELILEESFERARGAENPNALGIAHRCHGLLLAASGDLARGIDALDEALVQHALRPLPLELGRTLLEKGTLERRAKHKSAAKRSLEQALAALEPIEAAMWATRARDELGRLGLRKPAVSDGLTPAQQRVAELVAAGMSNREIASTLYMSLRTVETHLTRVYREFGVRSRTQLAATLTRSTTDTAADADAAGNRSGAATSPLQARAGETPGSLP